MVSLPASASIPSDYPDFLAAVRERIRRARARALLSVNRELILLYWDLGRWVSAKHEQERWGTGIIQRISRDLRSEFPDMKGLSAQNIRRMRAFYHAWTSDGLLFSQLVRKSEPPIRSQLVSKLRKPHRDARTLQIPPEAVRALPWGHNVVLIESLRSAEERLWYAKAAGREGWSRSELIRQIASRLHARQGRAQTNFALTLPPPQATVAQEALKDEYALDFLAPGLTQEKDIEPGIIENTQRFLMELGKGFAFIGRQQRLSANGREYVIDLLLYHVVLHCYVVVELKARAFQPEHAGKLSACLSAADAALRGPGDEASIGLVLCRSKNKIIVEYALRDQRRPMGVACYRLTRELPGRLGKALPTARELEEGLSRSLD